MTVTGAPDVDPAAWRDLLVKNWMTHDAMWFGQAVLHHGIEAANDMNCAAVHAMAGVEAKRISKLLALGRVTSREALRRFFDAAIALVIPNFMSFDAEWSDDLASVTFRITVCFAHDGVAALGLIEQYRCGIYPRIYGWLDALGVPYRVEPTGETCLRLGGGECRRTIHFDLA